SNAVSNYKQMDVTPRWLYPWRAFAILALLLGLVASTYANPPPIALAARPQTPGHQSAIVVRIFLAVHVTAARSAWCIQYAYAGGDPVNRFDPTGLDWEYVDGGWKPIDGTPWVKPPPSWLTPEMTGSSRYGIIDHIAVRGAMRHPRLQQAGDVTVDE